MTNKNLCVLVLLMTSSAKAQTVTPTVMGADGGYSQSASGSIAWTIGEPVSESYTNASNITTMGFHQPVISIAEMIKEQGNDADLLVYPNPVRDELKISLSDLKKGNYSLEIIDGIGKLIYRKEAAVASGTEDIALKMGSYAAGSYFLVITGSSFYKSVKLIKTN